MNVRYSEIFASFQGEAGFAGTPTIWLRLFGCNLECNGFGQDNPTDPSTYELPYQKIDLTDITRFEDLPVFSKGCDSSYSWSAKYKHLVHVDTAEVVAFKMWELAKEAFGLQDGSWRHPKTGQLVQICVTGGEPMLWQKQMVAVLDSFDDQPLQLTIETNGTKPLQPVFENWIEYNIGTDVYFSISPKLSTVSGEGDAVKVDVIEDYFAVARGWTKFVVNGTQDCWDELEFYVDQILESVPRLDVWVMPVGATKEDQEHPTIAFIADEGMRRGYKIATRNHTYVYGNVIGS